VDRAEVTAYLDTHCAVWLYYGETQKLSARARAAVEQHELIISAMSVLELELLHEIGRTKQSAVTILAALDADVGLRVCTLPFHEIAAQALKENWTRDPFDRLIVANAKVAGAPLVSRDERIRKHYREAVW
jgi:PIN domain nuclease of toxin-antitoxin system